MAIESTARMLYDADASSVLEQNLKIEASEKQWQKTTLDAIRAANEGYKVLTKAMEDQVSVTRDMAKEQEKLKKKLDESHGSMHELGKSFHEAKEGIEKVKNIIVGSEIVKAIGEWVEKMTQFNEQVIASQTNADKQARKFQVQAMMGDADFMAKVLPDVNDVRKENRVPLQTVLEAYTAAQQQGIAPQNLKDVVGMIVAGAKASNIGNEGVAAFGEAMIDKLRQHGIKPEEIDKQKMANAVLPMVNIAARMGLKGEDVLAQQHQLGTFAEAMGLDENQLTAQALALKPQYGKEAGTALEAFFRKLKSDQGQKAMGPEVAKVVNEQLEQGSSIGAVSALSDALNQLPKDQRDATMQALFGDRRTFKIGRLLVGKSGEALSLMGQFGNVDTFKRRAEIARSGPVAEHDLAQGEKQVADILQGTLAHKNEVFMDLLDAELQKAGVSPGKRSYVRSGFGPMLGLKGAAALGIDLTDRAKRGNFPQEDINWIVGPEIAHRVAEQMENLEKGGEPIQLPGVRPITAPRIARQQFNAPFAEDPLDKALREAKERLHSLDLQKKVLEDQAIAKHPQREHVLPGERHQLGIDKLDASIRQLELTIKGLTNKVELRKDAQPRRNGKTL